MSVESGNKREKTVMEKVRKGFQPELLRGRAPNGDLIFHDFPDGAYAQKVMQDLKQKFGVIVGLCTSRIQFTYNSGIEITEQNPEFVNPGIFVNNPDEATALKIVEFISRRKCKSYFKLEASLSPTQKEQ